MKVGIMSMQRVRNMGSFLQAYGLKKIIESLGHEVTFVDYRMNSDSKTASAIPARINFNMIVRFLDHRSTSKKRKMYKTAASFDSYYDSFMPLLGVTPELQYETEVDTLVIGSDEVFNCFQSSPKNVDSFDLFGENSHAEKCISYAASFGSTTINMIKNSSDKDRIQEDLCRFDSLSVRDNNSYQIIKELIPDSKVGMHLDPALIYDFSDEIAETSENEPYIVVYSYRGRITKEEGKAIRKFAKAKGMKLVCTGFVQECCDEYLLLNPFEVLGLFKNACYVITDTFHGTVLSIKYGKQFATIIRENNKQKLTDLLEKFSLSERKVTNLGDLARIADSTYNLQNVQFTLENEKKKTIEYLKRSI